MSVTAGSVARRSAVLGLLLSLLLAGLAAAKPEKPAKMIDSLLNGLGTKREPGAAVMVLKEGWIFYLGVHGIADLPAMRPIDGRTNFRLASLTKAFTAAAVMLLVRDGQLHYEDRLTDLLPGFPDYGQAITVRHLLNHTSGLPDYEDFLPEPDPKVPAEGQQIDDAGVLEILKARKGTLFVPGMLWKYSNSGYVVLGLIVAKISGQSFPAFLRERIFLPLKMTETVAHIRGKSTIADRAFGYAKDGDRWRFADQSPTSATLGDGGVYSSLYDLSLWDQALRRNLLLSEEEMRPALTPVRSPGKGPTGPDGRPADYGFGWFLDGWQGHPRMWHYGETSGFRTAIHRFTEDGLTVIVLANRTDVDASALAVRIAGFYLGAGK
jgi:CubicO group peptidase (beta-lactamase class C family)